MRIHAKRATAILAWLWFCGFCLCILIPGSLLIRRGIGWENFIASLETISGLYVPYVGVILTYYFVAGKLRRARLVDGMPFAVAIATSIVWNVTILTMFVLVLLGNYGIEDALKISPRAGSALCWIVAPSIGFFYGHSGGDKK